jgi:DNA-binding PadR family transcriptional regulator
VAADYRCSEPALLILIALADGPKHGYAMTQDILQVSGQQIGPGTLYGAIAWLEERGWIEALEAEDRRRPYQLTKDGHAALRARVDQLRALTRAGHAKLADT